jgi:transcriptional regulator with XRE-family HTH domain
MHELLNSASERRWGKRKLLRHGALLRALRESSGRTQKEMCKLFGMSEAQLSEIERGIGTLSLRRAHTMSVALGEPLLEIVQAVLLDRLEEAGFDLTITVSVAKAEQ